MNATWFLLSQTMVQATPKVFLLVVSALGLMVPILLIALVVAAVAQSRKAAVITGLALFGAVVLLVVVLSLFLVIPTRVSMSPSPGARSTEFPPSAVERMLPTPPSPATPQPISPQRSETIPDPISSTSPNGLPFPASDPWDRVAEDTLSASVYSTAANAARALAREAVIELSSQMAETPGAVVVVLDAGLSQRYPALYPQVDAVLRNAFPLASVRQSLDESESGDSGQLVIQLDQPEWQGLPNNGPNTEGTPPDADDSILPDHWLPQATGTMRLRATYPDRAFEGVNRHVQKPWVDQFDLFVSSQPERTLLRADCRTFANDEASAYGDAVDTAVNVLLPRTMTLLRAEADRDLRHAPEDRVRQQLLAALQHDYFVVDRFSQELEGRFGNVWRATLLVEFRPDELTEMAHRGYLVQRTEQRREMATGLAVVLMLGLVVALYIVLNELTKGYFVWNLRAATMLALLTMVVAFCWWIG